MEALDNNHLWIGALIIILIICLLTSRGNFNFVHYPQTGGSQNNRGATFIPSTPWIKAPEWPSPYRTDQFYLGGSTKCFSCGKDLKQRGGPNYLGRHTRCFDCESQAIQTLGPEGGELGQPSKCFSCDSTPTKDSLNRADGQDLAIKDSVDYGNSMDYGADNQTPLMHHNDYDGPQDSSADLVKGFGGAEGLYRREGETQNPMDYRLASPPRFHSL